MDVARTEPWFRQWVAQVISNIEQCLQWGATDITIVAILSGFEVPPVTEQEWPELKRLIKEGCKSGRVKGGLDTWTAIEFRSLPIRQLKKTLRDMHGDQFVLLASVPEESHQEAREMIGENRNTLVCWSDAGDLGINGWPRASAPLHHHWTDSLTPSRRNSAAAKELVSKGVGLEKQNDLDSAVAAFRKAVHADPQCADAWVQLGLLLQGKKSDRVGAETAFREAINADPEDVRAWNLLAALLKDDALLSGMLDALSLQLFDANEKPPSGGGGGGGLGGKHQALAGAGP